MKKDDSFRKRMIEATKLNRMDEAAVKKRIARLYEQAAYELSNEAKLAPRDGLTEIFKRQLSESMRKKMHGLWKEVESLTVAGMERAADRAVGIHTGTLATAAEIGGHVQLAPRIKNIFASVPHESVLNVLSGGVYGGKSPGLSRRIWNNEALQAGKIEDVIAVGIAKKLSPIQLAKHLEAYINPKLAMPDDWTDVYPDMPFVVKTDYNAKRLAVTSIRHAAYQSTISAARRNPYTQFIHWELTDAHVIYDVCDGYAEHDEGYGAGNFSFDAAPLPHPWCTCLWYADGLEDLDEIAEDIGEWVEDEERRFEKEYGISLSNFARQINASKSDFLKNGKTGIELIDRIIERFKPIRDEDYFTKDDPHKFATKIKVNKRKVDAEVSNSVIKTLNRISQDFPTICEIETIDLSKKVSSIGCAYWGKQMISLDSKTFATMKKAQRLLQKAVKTGHTVNTNDPMFIVSHELGHFLHYNIIYRNYDASRVINEFSNLLEETGEKIVQETMRHFGIKEIEDFNSRAMEKLGYRILDGRTELLAQSVAMHYNGSVETPIADYIVQLMGKWLNGGSI